MMFSVDCKTDSGNHVKLYRGIRYTNDVVLAPSFRYGSGGQIILTPEKAREMAAELVRLAGEIEPKAAPAVSVGDKVRVLRGGQGSSLTKTGDVLTVTEVESDYFRGVLPAGRSVGFYRWRLTNGDMERITPEVIAVGDRVRIDHATYAERTHGKTGTVVEVDDTCVLNGENHPYAVCYTRDDGGTHTVNVRDLTKLPAEAPLAVGDKLRVLIGGQGCATTKAGDILTVVGVGSKLFGVKLPSGRTAEFYLHRLTDGTVERLDAAKLETEAQGLFAEFRTACERLGISLK